MSSFIPSRSAPVHKPSWTLGISHPKLNANNRRIVSDARSTLAIGSRTWISEEHRKSLQELVRRQKRAWAAARKLAEERERERNQRIAENLAATAEAAKLAAKRSLHLKKGKFSAASGLKSRRGENPRNGINVDDDEIPSECALRASQLLAEEENAVFKKPRCPTTQRSPGENRLSWDPTASISAVQSVYMKLHESKNRHSVVSSTPLFNPSKFPSGHLHKSFPAGSNANTVNSRIFSGRSGAAIVSTSLPLKSRTIKASVGGCHSKVPRTKGFGVQVDLHDSISFRGCCGLEPKLGVWILQTLSSALNVCTGYSRHTEVIIPWKDAESEQARLQARLCASRARRFVHLDADGDDANDNDTVEVLTSSSSSSASSKSGCISEAQQVANFLEPTKKPDDIVVKLAGSPRWIPKTGRPGMESGTPLRSLFDSHLKCLQEQSKSESDPLRFMEVYKQKCRQLTTHPRGDSHTEASPRATHQVRVSGTHFNHGGCTSASEVDKTSEAASSIPSLVEEAVHPTRQVTSHRHQMEVQQRQRLAPAALGLSLTAELHRYETLSASEQHITNLEMTRQISQAQAEELSIYHLSKAGYLHEAQGSGSCMMRVEHMKELKNTAVSPVVFPRVSEPVTLTQTITQRSFTTTATAATTALLHDSNRIGGTDFNAGSSSASYNAPRRAGADASSMNLHDANVTPSNLEVSAALGELVDVKSEQFKGILQQRASELHARRHEAELLLKYAARLDREERKVVALESRAAKALTRSKDRHPAAEGYIPLQQLSHSPSSALPTLKAPRGSPPSPTPPPPPTVSVPLPPSTSPSCSSPAISPSTGRVSVVKGKNNFSVGVQESVASLSDQPSSRSNTKLISPQHSSSRPRESLCSHAYGAENGESDRAGFSQQHPLLRHHCEHRNHQPQISSPRRLSQDSTNSTSSSPSGLHAYSESLSSSEFVSQLEARLASLQRELRRNEKLLSRIDAQKKMANRDRLMRLETTLENHRKFCLGIIDNIKIEINSCHQSLCEKSQPEAAPAVQMTPSGATLTSSSPEPSFSGKSMRQCFREPRRDTENTMSLLSSCLNAEEEAVESICTVSVEMKEASAPSETDPSNSPRGEKAFTSKLDVGQDGELKHLVSLETVKSASSKTSAVAKSGETIASELSSESSPTQRLISPTEMNLIVKFNSMHPASSNSAPSEGCVSPVETLSSKTSLDNRIPSPLETKTSPLKPISNEQNSSAALKRSNSVESGGHRSIEGIIASEMPPRASVSIRTPSPVSTKTEASKPDFYEQKICSAVLMHSSTSKCVKPTGFGSSIKMLSSEAPSKASAPTGKISSPADSKTILKSGIDDGDSKAALSEPLKLLENGVVGSLNETQPSEMALETSTSVKPIYLLVETEPRVDAKREVETKEVVELKTITPIEVLLPSEKPESVGSNQSGTEVKENGSDSEEEKDEKSCLVETIASELSLKTPSLNSDTHSVEVQELKSAKASTHQFTTGSSSESASETDDVYTEDFEDEAFADEVEKQEHGSVESADAVLERQVSAFTPSSDFVEAKTNALLNEFINQWLDNFIGEGINSVLEEAEETVICELFITQVITDTTGMVVNTPSRTVLLFKDAMKFFFQLRASSEPGTFEEVLNSIQYPPHFTETYAEEEDLEICERVPQSRLVNRSLFFDLIRIGMLDIFAGEDEDVKNNREPRLNSARLHMWHGRHRPESQSRWEAILAPQLEAILGMSLDPAASSGPSPLILPRPQVFDPSVLRSSLVRWTLNSKACWIEQLLETELREEDPSWFNFKPFEEQVVDTVIMDITSELANDMILSVLTRLNYGHELEKQRQEEHKETGKSVILL
ncbi:unnamed protein product [Taenia asiatica]|uniref:Serine-rich adhesin for platelets-like n=1 Tax=Taenia asiatica TaxID=60517 RepID=A0A158R7A5_TAEAS|nr:unnamed protein product [Taenia asiatica]